MSGENQRTNKVLGADVVLMRNQNEYHSGQTYTYFHNRAGRGFAANREIPYQPLGVPVLNLKYKYKIKAGDDCNARILSGNGLYDDDDKEGMRKLVSSSTLQTSPDRGDAPDPEAPLYALLNIVREANARRVVKESTRNINDSIHASQLRLRRVRAGQSLLQEASLRARAKLLSKDESTFKDEKLDTSNLGVDSSAKVICDFQNTKPILATQSEPSEDIRTPHSYFSLSPPSVEINLEKLNQMVDHVKNDQDGGLRESSSERESDLAEPPAAEQTIELTSNLSSSNQQPSSVERGPLETVFVSTQIAKNISKQLAIMELQEKRPEEDLASRKLQDPRPCEGNRPLYTQFRPTRPPHRAAPSKRRSPRPIPLSFGLSSGDPSVRAPHFSSSAERIREEENQYQYSPFPKNDQPFLRGKDYIAMENQMSQFSAPGAASARVRGRFGNTHRKLSKPLVQEGDFVPVENHDRPIDIERGRHTERVTAVVQTPFVGAGLGFGPVRAKPSQSSRRDKHNPNLPHLPGDSSESVAVERNENLRDSHKHASRMPRKNLSTATNAKNGGEKMVEDLPPRGTMHLHNAISKEVTLELEKALLEKPVNGLVASKDYNLNPHLATSIQSRPEHSNDSMNLTMSSDANGLHSLDSKSTSNEMDADEGQAVALWASFAEFGMLADGARRPLSPASRWREWGEESQSRVSQLRALLELGYFSPQGPAANPAQTQLIRELTVQAPQKPKSYEDSKAETNSENQDSNSQAAEPHLQAAKQVPEKTLKTLGSKKANKHSFDALLNSARHQLDNQHSVINLVKRFASTDVNKRDLYERLKMSLDVLSSERDSTTLKMFQTLDPTFVHIDADMGCMRKEAFFSRRELVSIRHNNVAWFHMVLDTMRVEGFYSESPGQDSICVLAMLEHLCVASTKPVYADPFLIARLLRLIPARSMENRDVLILLNILQRVSGLTNDEYNWSLAQSGHAPHLKIISDRKNDEGKQLAMKLFPPKYAPVSRVIVSVDPSKSSTSGDIGEVELPGPFDYAFRGGGAKIEFSLKFISTSGIRKPAANEDGAKVDLGLGTQNGVVRGRLADLRGKSGDREADDHMLKLAKQIALDNMARARKEADDAKKAVGSKQAPSFGGLGDVQSLQFFMSQTEHFDIANSQPLFDHCECVIPAALPYSFDQLLENFAPLEAKHNKDSTNLTELE